MSQNLKSRFQAWLKTLFAHAVVICFVLPIIILARPFVRLRFIHLFTARLGNLALNTHQYFADRIVNGAPKRSIDIFYGFAPCNRQLFTMWQRYICLMDTRFFSAVYQYLGHESWVRRLECFAPLPNPNERHRSLALAMPIFSFTQKEKDQGGALLESMGMKPDDWFITFQSRDPDFHLKRGVGGDNKQHRNCNIETFLKAARYIAEAGGYAIRVGSTAAAPLPEGLSPRIIDYTSKYRSDFGDIFLLGSGRFLLGSGTGTCEIPPLFGKTVIQTNILPLMVNAMGPRSLFIPKLLRKSQTGEWATFTELAQLDAFVCTMENIRKWDNAAFYDQLGLDIIENDEDEILDACLDMLDRVEGRAPPGDSIELQKLFKRRFLAPAITEYEYAPDISPRFALKYRALIEA